MAVPRNRHSNARKNKKRAHLSKTPVHTVSCSTCGEKKLPHRICQKCGHYKKQAVENAGE